MSTDKPHVALITPAAASANNGNWQTAQRWARMLAADYEVRVTQEWDGTPADVMLALHARRSAASIRAWAAAVPRRPLVVVLTGTDLYRDIQVDADARRSLDLADRIVVLHEQAPNDVPAEVRGKCVVCLQSCSARRTLPKTSRHLRALMVGHLREEKDPRTYFAAARLLAGRADILLDHVGAALDPAFGAEADALMAVQPGYRWLGAQPHRATLDRIQRAHVLVHASRMEGGAHVVMEALRSGTPVLASRIAGNVGMLGRDYAGWFEPGDAPGLAAALRRARDEPAMLVALRTQCERRAPLFDPAREQATLRGLIRQLLETAS
jgi:putative glycosyltransferase (TIGR04348 family)